MNSRGSTLALLLVAATGGCGDDLRIEDELHPDTGRREADDDGNILHGPYASGSRFGVRLAGVAQDECLDLTLAGDDGEVLALARDAEDPCRWIVLATGPGRTTLRVLEGDDERVAAGVEVAVATRATVHPRALLAAGQPGAEPSWTDARVVVGTTATFTVRWWDEAGRELAAHELLVPTATEGIGLGAAQGHSPNVDALQVTPHAAGSYTAEVGTASERMAAIEIEAVEADAVLALTLIEGAVPGGDERLALLALGEDADGEPLLGLQPTWTMDGAQILDDQGEPDDGDLFLYEEGDDARHVVATVNGASVEADVRLEGTPSVESSNGCHGVPGVPAPAGALALLAAALFARLRRRVTLA